MSNIMLRPATNLDAADIALIDNIAGHGISLWFWQREVKSGLVEDALALGRSRLCDPKAFYGVPNAMVATENEIILGAVTSYIMPAPDDESEKLKREAPAFTPLFELFDLCEGHWFIDSLGVYPESRGKGVGAKLLNGALERGRAQNQLHTSLIVEDSNLPARKLYDSFGFEHRATKPFVEFRGPSETKQWIMLSRELS